VGRARWKGAQLLGEIELKSSVVEHVNGGKDGDMSRGGQRVTACGAVAQNVF
jgi:hypothetical protein